MADVNQNVISGGKHALKFHYFWTFNPSPNI